MGSLLSCHLHHLSSQRVTSISWCLATQSLPLIFLMQCRLLRCPCLLLHLASCLPLVPRLVVASRLVAPPPPLVLLAPNLPLTAPPPPHVLLTHNLCLLTRCCLLSAGASPCSVCLTRAAACLGGGGHPTDALTREEEGEVQQHCHGGTEEETSMAMVDTY